MSNRRPISDELRPYVDGANTDAIDDIGEQLHAARPTPSPAYRAALKARLVDAEAKGGLQWRPNRLRLTVTAYASSGLVLLVIAALGVAGSGPLAY